MAHGTCGRERRRHDRRRLRRASANLGDYFAPDGDEPKLALAGVPREKMAALAEITIEPGGRTKIKLWDKRAALADLGRLLIAVGVMQARSAKAEAEQGGMVMIDPADLPRELQICDDD